MTPESHREVRRPDVMPSFVIPGSIGVSIRQTCAAQDRPQIRYWRRFDRPDPFCKDRDTAIRAIQRGGKKKGALCFYMENWHLDFPEFIDWKHNAGDDYMRMRTANTGCILLSDGS